jgi:hypothetical protein
VPAAVPSLWTALQDFSDEFNLLEYIIQPRKARCAVTARKALRLALRSVVGEKVVPFVYQLDRDLDRPWLIEFFYGIPPAFECITYPEVFGDGSVAPVPTGAAFL